MNLIKILEPGLKAGYFSRDYVVDHPTMSRGLQEPKKKPSHNETWKIWNGQLFGYFCVVQQINLPNDEKSDQDGCEPTWRWRTEFRSKEIREANRSRIIILKERFFCLLWCETRARRLESKDRVQEA